MHIELRTDLVLSKFKDDSKLVVRRWLWSYNLVCNCIGVKPVPYGEQWTQVTCLSGANGAVRIKYCIIKVEPTWLIPIEVSMALKSSCGRNNVNRYRKNNRKRGRPGY